MIPNNWVNGIQLDSSKIYITAMLLRELCVQDGKKATHNTENGFI